MATCPAVFGLVVQVATLVTAAVSNLTPFWITSGDQHMGLWQTCVRDNCTWTKQSEIPEWLRVVRVVHAVAVANALVGLISAMGYLCCAGCRYNIRSLQFNILVQIVGCIETVCVITAYAIKYDAGNNSIFTKTSSLDWSFYVGMVSGGCFLLGLLCHVCETSNARRREQYQPIRPTSMS